MACVHLLKFDVVEYNYIILCSVVIYSILYFQTARHLTKTACLVREELKSICCQVIRNRGGSLSIDCWLDKHKKTTFLGVTIHFIIDEEGTLKLHDRILCTRELHIETKDGIYIRGKLMEYLASFDLETEVDNIVFVSDRGSNMIKAVEPYMSSHCFAHMMHNTVVKMFSVVPGIVDDVKSLVKYFKVTGLSSALETALKSYIKTRWNTIYFMMDSVVENWDDIVSILTMKNEMNRMAGIDKSTLEILCNFMKIFDVATKEIEASKSPTIHLVIPWYFKILKYLDFNGVDSAIVSNMKSTGRQYLLNNIAKHLSKYQKIAVFLYPMTKSMKMYNREQRQEIVEWARDLMNEKFPSSSNNTPRRSSSTSSQNDQNPSSNVSSALQMFRDDSFEDDDNSDDIEKYINMQIKSTDDSDVLTWWFQNKSLLPQLFKLSCFIFSIPASSASVERVFSLAGLTVKNRPNLNPTTLDDLLLLKSNHDLYEAAKDKVECDYD